MKRKREYDQKLEKYRPIKKQKILKDHKMKVCPIKINESEFLLISIKCDKNSFDKFKDSIIIFEFSHDEDIIFKYKPQKVDKSEFKISVDLIGLFACKQPVSLLDFGLKYLAPEAWTPGHISSIVRKNIGRLESRKKKLRNMIKKDYEMLSKCSLRIRIKDDVKNNVLYDSKHDVNIILY